MDMEAAVRARLLAAPAVTAIVGTRVYWEDRPQNSALPAITLSLPVDIRDQHLGGFQSVRDVTLQVDCWCRSYAEKKGLKEAVIATLFPAQISNGVRFQWATSIDVTPLNERVETQMIFRDAIRMTLHFSAA
jgi:hypothetical protein